MKTFLLLLIFLFIEESPALISEFQSTNQLILIFARDNRSELYERTLLEIAKDPLGMDKRDVLIFEIFRGGGIHPNGSSLSEEEVKPLWDFYRMSENDFMIILIDKKSKEIFRSDRPMKAADIAAKFDAQKGKD
jgi:hypothetical protein